MTESKRELGFLSKHGMFRDADLRIPDDSFDNLLASYQISIINSDLQKAKLFSQKLSILYGFKGLYLYLPVQLSLIEKDQENQEIIDQALIKTLSLIFFIEKSNPSDAPLDTINEQKQKCLEMCQAEVKDEICYEANILADMYPKP